MSREERKMGGSKMKLKKNAKKNIKEKAKKKKKKKNISGERKMGRSKIN